MSLDFENGVVELAHGAGGRAQESLLQALFLPEFDNSELNAGNDQASLIIHRNRIVVATDSHVISPLFFKGGDIGALSVHGTVNDIVCAAARPIALTAGFIIEEGFPLADLQRIVQSMAKAARHCSLPIVTGDTKVVERGQADGVYINTTGIGILEHSENLGVAAIKPSDSIIISGSIGDHGATIHSHRQGFSHTELKSDSAALHGLVQTIMPHLDSIRCMRDPTRGGLATALNELASHANTGALLDEAAISISSPVQAYCEVMGLDPFYLANEGKLIIICDPQKADVILACLRSHMLGKHAAIIGQITEDTENFVELTTRYGGKRLLDWRYSDPLPRIC